MKRYIEELFKKRSRWVDVNRDNGFDEGLSRLLRELHPDNAHFLYELLQNAEDAQAREVSFKLTKESLRFTHDGQEFEKVDIDGITGIGTNKKKNDLNTIGTFGVGFKAVFNYTSSPHIFCDSCGFAITEMVCPIWLEHPNDLVEGMTRFEFPFDNPKKNQKLAFEEISEGLGNFSSATLLFLHNIKEIRWEVVGEKEHFLRLEEEDEFETLRVYSVESDSKDHSARWLRLSAPCKEAPEQSVSIAFKLEAKKTKKNQHSFQIVETEGTFCIFFPADKETTKLKFHIHAPFNSTVARDSISYPKEDNISLRNQLVQLLVDSLPMLRDAGLLTSKFLEILPNRIDELGEFYEPFIPAVVAEMQANALVPTASGNYALAGQLARGPKRLRDFIDDEDIQFLSGDEYQRWAVGTFNPRAELFLKELGIPEWSGRELVDVITSKWNGYCDDEDADWLKQKDIPWLRSLYLCISDENFIDDLEGCAIVFAADGAFKKPEDVVFRPEGNNLPDLDDISFVHCDILKGDKGEVQKIRGFLESLGVMGLDEKHFIKSLLSKHYKANNEPPPAIEEHLEHIQRFICFLQTESACRDTFQGYSFLLGDAPKGRCFNHRPENLYILGDAAERKRILLQPEKLYIDLPYIDTGLNKLFSGLNSSFMKYRLSAEYADIEGFTDFAKALNVPFCMEPQKCRTQHNDKIKWVPGSRETFTGKDDDYELPPCSKKPRNDINVSLLIWNMMSSVKPRQLKARYRPNQEHVLQCVESQLVQALSEMEWVPDQNGNFHKPAEMTSDELPVEFVCDDNNGWLTAIGFGEKVAAEEFERRETTKRLRAAGIDMPREEIQEFNAMSKKERQALLEEHRSRKAAEVEPPEHDPKHPERRKDKTEEGYGDAPDKTYVNRERAVRQTALTQEARTYLEPLNTNDDGQLICQMCRHEMPFRLRNRSYYFEAVQIVDDLKKESRELYLALCPLCAAKYKLLVKKHNACITSFREVLTSSTGTTEFSIDMHDSEVEPLSLRFTGTHIQGIKTILACENHASVDASSGNEPGQQEEELGNALSNTLLGERVPLDIMNKSTGEVLIPAGRIVTKTYIHKIVANAGVLEIDPSPIRIKIMSIINEHL